MKNICTSPFEFSLLWSFIQRNKAISILKKFYKYKKNDKTTKNNFTFCWSSKANGGEPVRPGIFMIDVVDGEWWIFIAHFNANPSSGFSVYFNSIFTPKYSMNWRILADCRNFTHQSDWTIFIISFMIYQNIRWS